MSEGGQRSPSPVGQPNRRISRTGLYLWLAATIACAIAWLLLRDPFELELGGTAGRLLSMLAPGRWSSDARLWHFDALSLRILASRGILVAAATFGGVLCVLHWRRVRAEIADLFGASAHPLNLAVFRIVVFSQVLSILWLDYIALISSLPNELQFPPATGVPAIGPLTALTHWFVHPLGPEQVLFWGNALRVAAVMGMVGLFTRFSSAFVAAGLFFVWGTLQWYGKVDHHHHLLWFTLVLALARSGDALSVDAMIAAWRRGGRGDTTPPGPATVYGAPLAVCMALIGVIYLFPGVWKWMTSGLDWALSESPKHTMHRKWHTNGQWLPMFRFDDFPLLYRGGSLFTLAFEITMLPLVLWRRTRLLAAGLGIWFHLMTQLTMDIGFETLQRCYVVFFDWHRIANWVRRKVSGDPVERHYDPGRRSQCRGVAIARVFDVFGAVRWVPRKGTSTAATPTAPAAPSGARAVLWVGALLLAANLSMGARRIQEGWPIACYPRFDGLTPDHYETLQIHVVAVDGSERTLLPSDYRDLFGNRWSLMMRRIVNNRDTEQRRAQLRSVWRVVVERDPSLAQAAALRFSMARVWTDPDRWDEAPVSGDILDEIPLEEIRTERMRR